MRAEEIAQLLPFMTDAERAEVQKIVAGDKAVWRALPGPQAMAYYSTADVVGYGGAAGGGKGLWVGTNLPTPSGFIRMGDVQVGQELFDERGQVCRVTAVSEVSHRPCYRLKFDDLSMLIADDVHRWRTFNIKELAALTRRDPEWQARRRETRAKRGTGARPDLAVANMLRVHVSEPVTGAVRDTAELVATETVRGRTNHAIPVAAPIDLPTADLPIDPYTLGAWLGDGTSRSGDITGEDGEIWENIRAAGYEVRPSTKDRLRVCVIGLKVQLRALGVLENKHVPAIYLRGSIAQRMALLQGLMDTDGHAAVDGGCEFDNTNFELASAVSRLVVSLGVKAAFQVGRATLGGCFVSARYRVKFTTDQPVFRLSRKLARLKPCRRTTRFRYLTGIDPWESVPTRCIAVDSPSRLYLAGENYIPTHNTDLACGKALTQHQKVMILRREATQLTGIIDRLTELIGSRDGYNGQDRIWRLGKRQIEFGSVPNLGDETKYQGRPHDLLVFDEATNFLEPQVRFLLGWLRTTQANQHCQALLTFNPPTTAEGRWVMSYFAPWLDDKHPAPARPGELRWYATIDGVDQVCETGDPFNHDGEVITPQSRTFIPSRVSDNPYLTGTGYLAQLQSLPEPLRSQMLKGDFMAGVEDDPWQVIPTLWVDQAMARWEPRAHNKGYMDSMGVDVARGGKDETILYRRHGAWFDEALVYPGASTPDGPTLMAHVLSARRDRAPVHIDIIGWGASPYDFLVQNEIQTVGINAAERSGQYTKDANLTLVNKRAELWWRMREALDPKVQEPISLPPDNKLRADLCAPLWKLTPSGIMVELKEDIRKRIGRSPDRGDAAVMALMATMKRSAPEKRYSGSKGSSGRSVWV